MREIRELREEGKRERGEVVESLEGIKKEIEEMKEDLTFRERKIRWILRRFAEEERKKGRAIIELEEWDRYFKGLLGGVEWRVRRGMGREMGEDGEEELKIEEIREVIKRLKDGKAIGGDGVPNEVWKYGGGN